MNISLSKIAALPFKEQYSLIKHMHKDDFIECLIQLIKKYPNDDTTELQLKFIDELRIRDRSVKYYDFLRLLTLNVNYVAITKKILNSDDIFNLNYVITAANKKDIKLARLVLDTIVDNIEGDKLRISVLEIFLSNIIIGYDYRKVVKLLFNAYKDPTSQSLVQKFKEKVGSKELNDYIREQLMIEDILS